MCKFLWGMVLFMGWIGIATPSAWAQKSTKSLKYERETRLKPEAVPAPAMGFIQQLELPARIKWYSEQSLDQRSVEAKFEYLNQRHSVEFDSLGQLQDVEVEVPPGELPAALRQTVADSLSRRFARHRIRKVQLQYLDGPAVLSRIIRDPAARQAAMPRYELVVKGKNAGGTHLYELLFEASGRLISSKQIIFRNADHLTY